jgi:molybdate transport system substrate-binding protein
LSKIFRAVLFSTLIAAAQGADIHVMASGALTEAYRQLAPQFEHATGNKLITEYGASMGGSPGSIPNRLKRGEPADVVMLAGSALADLITSGMVMPESRVDLVRSKIGLAVRSGSPKPDIGSVEALKRTLLAAASIGYSDSASGVYVSTELLPKLGIAEQVRAKSRRFGGSVGEAIARGEAEIGFQQVSELLPVKGIDFVGPIPEAVQKVTVFSAGIPVAAKDKEAARALIRFLASRDAAGILVKTGLEPIGRR